MSNLTLEGLLAAIDAVKVTQWYATSDFVETDQVIIISARSESPELWVMHPDTFAKVRAAAPALIRFRHIRERVPDPATFPRVGRATIGQESREDRSHAD